MYTYAEEKGDEGQRVEYVGHYFLQLKCLLCRMNNNNSWRGEDEDARPVVMADQTLSSASPKAWRARAATNLRADKHRTQSRGLNNRSSNTKQIVR